MTTAPRVLMVALDALDARLFDQLCANGRLPNLAAFAAEATRVPVASDGRILHGSVWPTFASGTNPGTHGVYFWTQWLAEEMRHVRNSHAAFAFEPWWASALAAGKSATIIDVPYVPAVASANLRQLSGWGLHDEIVPITHPEAFGAEVRRRFGKHPLEFDTLEPHSPQDKLAMARDMRRGVHLRTRLLRWLLRDARSDLVVTTFSELHKSSHYLASEQQLSARYSNLDAMAAILQPLDAAFPEIVRLAGPETQIVLFALHGTEEQIDYSQFGTQLADLINGREAIDPTTRPDLLRRVRDLVPDSVHRAIWKRLPPSVRAARQGQLSLAGADFSRDRLFTVTHDGHPAVRVNERERERDGIVPAEDAEGVLEQLWGLASGLRTDSGADAFLRLYRPGQAFPGPRANRLPDALLVANPKVTRASRLTTPDGRVLHSSRPEARNGVHTGEGFCLVRSPAGGPCLAASEMDNLDFGPTALEMLGVAVPGSLQGRSVLA